MRTIEFPGWLEDLIYNKFGATRNYEGSMFQSKDWNEEQIKGYLGTYFPRSYGEARYIFDYNFITLSDAAKERFSNCTNMHVLDFCSGTGGQLLGLLDCIEDNFKSVTNVTVSYIDANPIAYLYLDRILKARKEILNSRINVKVEYLICDIKSINDIKIANVWAKCRCSKYDLVMTFKGLCEFVKSDVDAVRKLYTEYMSQFHNLIAEKGFFVVEDVASYVKIEGNDKWMDNLLCDGLSAADKFEYQFSRNQDWEQSIQIKMAKHKELKSNVIWHVLRGVKQWDRHDVPFD